ncbi:putative Autophagy-related protein 27 [Monocercomonoides exilis]|uniref:putative Autophagy-related protein 27 n=1 Tax=Monocercomonoides exilis TaxID=2049356 RepID=UPI00355A8F11|nr:putative Autophagy-related protein 27 [Monocercomonoides exilis]|eukprot:MONOS_11223.1-p1 / transcript=MONOS_11223.1 / gene=MONOS_11223 / organism=Monocercomonoides_exilis_PA203 / gene_product=unspecified product / transcript_product=unspecified product / location=Mono_scaffold00552:11698-12691(+) / protein_length=240 / sequence_SO=supercontig / SO=protein_coding / is_pseudo=false
MICSILLNLLLLKTYSLELSDFNFTGLARDSDNPYEGKIQSMKFWYNFNRSVPNVPSIGECEIPGCVIPTKPSMGDCYCYGDINNGSTTVLASDDGIKMKFDYDADYETRTAVIRFTCAKEEKVSLDYQNVMVTLNWEHPQGCPVKHKDPDDPSNPSDPNNPKNKKKLSFGSVMLIILSVLLVLYFAIGIPIMAFGLKKRGVEMIPFVFFWTAIPGLVVSGVKCIFQPCCNSARGFKEVS